MWSYIFFALLAYLLGSLPSGYLWVKQLAGKDIRRVGSGNVGAANAFRHISPLAGLLTFATDVLKGYLAVVLAYMAAPAGYLPLVAALMVVVGHNWMLFLRFKGGKGIAVTAGALLAMSFWLTFVVFAFMALLILPLRNANIAGAVGLYSLPVALAVFTGSFWGFVIGAAWAGVSTLKFSPDFEKFRLIVP